MSGPTFAFRLLTDGSGHADGYGGWAAHATEILTGRTLFRMGCMTGTSVERMELTALLEGLKMCLELGRLQPIALGKGGAFLPPKHMVEWFSDRESLVKTLTGEYRRSSEPDLWCRLDVMLTRLSVHATHVPRETDIPGFSQVDLHASTARVFIKSYALQTELPANSIIDHGNTE